MKIEIWILTRLGKKWWGEEKLHEYIKRINRWKVEIKDYDSNEQGQPNCSWKFYLNDEEVWHQKNTCAFTSNIGDKVGALKAEVTVDFTKSHYEQVPGEYEPDGEVKMKKVVETLDTIVVSRNFEIIPRPEDTHVYGE